MAFGDDAERTEDPTPRRLEKAREEGKTVHSREAGVAILFLSNVLFLSAAGASLYTQLLDLTRSTFFHLDTVELSLVGIHRVYVTYVQHLGSMVLPLFLTVFLCTLVGNLAHTGFFVSSHGLMPQWSHINPAQGLQRLLSMQGLNELVKSLFKIGVLGYVAYATLAGEVQSLLALSDRDVPTIVAYLGQSALRVCTRALYVIVALALFDYGVQRWQFSKSLRMTKQEIKEENKEQEGDPHIKARIRGLMREAARKRMMQEVPRATVVVTNPTHLAIALLYKREEMAAPQVIAKGAGYVAERIKALAREHDVPLVENKPVAQQLYKSVDLGGAVPESLYKAVAEILAYVYRLHRAL
ncbi:MAG: flagellar biosynthesis protein FlhB [Candidatus Tectimicrobiota bacterium]